MRALLVLCCLVLVAPLARAEWTPDPAQKNIELPPERPVKVGVKYYLLDIDTINGAEESFRASLYVEVSWTDPRMAFDAGAFGSDRVMFSGDAVTTQLGTMWSPQLDFSNMLEDPTNQDQTLVIRADGHIAYACRITGTFTSGMTLKRFPYDTQDLQIQLESFTWDTSEMVIVDADRESDEAHRHEVPEIRGWDLLGVDTRVSEHTYVTGEKYSSFISTIHVQRQSWFYMWDVVFPLFLVTFFALTCFFWEQSTLSERIAQVLTCLLTVTAQTLAVNDDLPKISYFTLIDYVFLLTYGVLLVVAVESIIVNRIDDVDRVRADRIDLNTAWITALVYTAGVGVIFWIGSR